MWAARDRAGNRELFFSDYCKLVLLYIWNPLIESVRSLQEAAALDGVSRALKIKRFSLGSFSESVRVFEAQKLKPIMDELAREAAPLIRDARLDSVKHALTLVDGTVLVGLKRLTHAACGIDGRHNRVRDGREIYGWRLHTQLDMETFRPLRMERTGVRNAGANRESHVLRRHLEAGRCYVGDCVYSERTLLDDIVDAKSVYVMRAAENSVCSVLEERLLTQEALDSGVVRDALVVLDGAGTRATRHAMRRVEVQVQRHPRRRVSPEKKQTDLIILHTNLLDLPAELIALIYQYRYTVELYFRVFKQLLGMRHLLSQRKEGIDIQVYCTVIVCLLISLMTGKKPDKYTRNMVGWYLLGVASKQEFIQFLNRPDNTGVKKRAEAELWKKLGY